MNNMFRINIFYNEGTSTNGKKYKVPHTIDLGFNCTVQLNSCKQTQIQWDEQLQTYYVVYNAEKAGLKINEKGYLVLNITD